MYHIIQSVRRIHYNFDCPANRPAIRSANRPANRPKSKYMYQVRDQVLHCLEEGLWFCYMLAYRYQFAFYILKLYIKTIYYLPCLKGAKI